MRKLFLIIIIFSLTSCSSDVKMFEHIDKKSNLHLIIRDSNSTGIVRRDTEIQINSDKYSRLLQWADKNVDGWQWSPASYASADIVVSQGSFRLLYWVDMSNAVIAFTDNNDKSHQYSKSIKKGDLDFLVE